VLRQDPQPELFDSIPMAREKISSPAEAGAQLEEELPGSRCYDGNPYNLTISMNRARRTLIDSQMEALSYKTTIP
jgi:hypothetical protein